MAAYGTRTRHEIAKLAFEAGACPIVGRGKKDLVSGSNMCSGGIY